MNRNIGIIGLGYVGLPLAYEFSKKYNTFGYDINEERINKLLEFNDNNLELTDDDLFENLSSFIHANIEMS